MEEVSEDQLYSEEPVMVLFDSLRNRSATRQNYKTAALSVVGVRFLFVDRPGKNAQIFIYRHGEPIEELRNPRTADQIIDFALQNWTEN